MHELPVLASQQHLHAFCRAHGWRVEILSPDDEPWQVDDWLSCRSRIVELRLRADADRCLLRGSSSNGHGPQIRAPHLHEPRAVREPCDDLDAGAEESPMTPRVLFLGSRARAQREAIGTARRAVRDLGLRLQVAYSIKTNPCDDALEFARSCGCLAEAVSQLEVSRAVAAGFTADQIVLNGPAKWWPGRIELPPLRAVFCDSPIELCDTLRRLRAGQSLASLIGIRLRPPQSGSRFGLEVDSVADVAAVAAALVQVPSDVEFGVHFHIASSEIGVANWFELCRLIVLRAAALQEASGVPVRCLDLGGGWHPDDFVDHLLPALPRIAAAARARLTKLDTIILEPGRALVQPTMALLTRVLEVRAHAPGRELLVDASISEVADAGRYPHPVLVRDPRSGGWLRLEEGLDRVAGRSCMETDIIASGLRVPPWVAPGHLAAIDHVGAYDTSKSYVFGCG